VPSEHLSVRRARDQDGSAAEGQRDRVRDGEDGMKGVRGAFIIMGDRLVGARVRRFIGWLRFWIFAGLS
jgi:hypothetical protein